MYVVLVVEGIVDLYSLYFCFGRSSLRARTHFFSYASAYDFVNIDYEHVMNARTAYVQLFEIMNCLNELIVLVNPL